jgi:hypothetical protein
MLFKKKKKGSVEIKLASDQFCRVLEEKAEDCSHKYCIDTDADQYNLMYRNGQFLGMPTPFGGSIYPFSVDPTKPGSARQKKQFNRAKIVCLSKDFNLKVFWGTRTPFIMEDCVTKKAYTVGASGVLYVEIDTNDAARSADKFYRKCLTQRDAELFNTEELRDFLSEAFVNRVGAKIQEYLEAQNRPLSNLVGLQPSEFLKISEELFPKMKDIFADYGLTVADASSGSILGRLLVNPVE